MRACPVADLVEIIGFGRFSRTRHSGQPIDEIVSEIPDLARFGYAFDLVRVVVFVLSVKERRRLTRVRKPRQPAHSVERVGCGDAVRKSPRFRPVRVVVGEPDRRRISRIDNVRQTPGVVKIILRVD